MHQRCPINYVSRSGSSRNGSCFVIFCWVNSLWPSDTIWRQRSGSTLAQVMACCLTAPSTISPSIFELNINQKFKLSEMRWLYCWHIQFPVSLQVKKFAATTKWCPFWKFWNINYKLYLTSGMMSSSWIITSYLCKSNEQHMYTNRINIYRENAYFDVVTNCDTHHRLRHLPPKIAITSQIATITNCLHMLG